MGECPRYFKLEVITNNPNTNKKEMHKLQNLKPEWNEEMDCYCLNFYGRVKKASAKNFQIIYPDDNDNILLQHGKVNKDEFNIDFREPFNFVYAFAVSLVSIGKKRVVS
jgi:tubby-related protein 1